jgi:hypothetical protein
MPLLPPGVLMERRWACDYQEIYAWTCWPGGYGPMPDYIKEGINDEARS